MGPSRVAARSGVLTVAVPMSDPSGQLAGLAWKTAARHAFWSVVRREGSCRGNVSLTFAVFACPGVAVTLIVRLAPSSLLVFAWVDAVRTGLKGSVAQFAAW